jgi:TPP-dependent pyruvate/acetoin dehydrogenase alpha subunit
MIHAGTEIDIEFDGKKIHGARVKSCHIQSRDDYGSAWHSSYDMARPMQAPEITLTLDANFTMTHLNKENNMSLTTGDTETLKILRWVRDGGDHTHVNAPTAQELEKLEGIKGPTLLEHSVWNDKLTEVEWAPRLTPLGSYELARLEARTV